MQSVRSQEDSQPQDDSHREDKGLCPASKATVYFSAVERLRAYLRLRSRRVRPQSHTRLKFTEMQLEAKPVERMG